MTSNHIFSPSRFYFCHFAWCDPRAAWCAHLRNLAAVTMQWPRHLPSLVLSGVCSRDQRHRRISQVIFSDLENQSGSSFCPRLAAVTQRCLAWLRWAVAPDTVPQPPHGQDGVGRANCVLTLYMKKTPVMLTAFPFALWWHSRNAVVLL